MDEYSKQDLEDARADGIRDEKLEQSARELRSVRKRLRQQEANTNLAKGMWVTAAAVLGAAGAAVLDWIKDHMK